MDPELFDEICEWIIETTKKYLFQEAVLKPLKDRLPKTPLKKVTERIKKTTKGFKVLPPLTDDQAIKAFYIVMIAFFGTLTLYLSGGERLDLFARLTMLCSATATIVGVVFYSLVSANIRAR